MQKNKLAWHFENWPGGLSFLLCSTKVTDMTFPTPHGIQTIQSPKWTITMSGYHYIIVVSMRHCITFTAPNDMLNDMLIV